MNLQKIGLVAALAGLMAFNVSAAGLRGLTMIGSNRRRVCLRDLKFTAR